MGGDTIAAIATAMTNAGIGIIRISGTEAVHIADQMIRLKGKKKKISECGTHTIHYGFVMDGERIVDEVMAVIMKAPRSYTKEDTIEIDCHGGTLVMRTILDLAIRCGARAAEPGEFTKRAFLNGRIDLAQAESVIDLINAKNEFALKASVDQLNGIVSETVEKMRKKILYEIAYIESAIDDPEHYDLEDYGERLLSVSEDLLSEISGLLNNAENGSLLKEGIHTVIVGKPNAGKSSLLNVLAGKERAIVTEVAGTTRDAIEEQVLLNGICLNVIDTAGIRSTEDLVEKIGVDKAKEYIEKAELVLYLVDASIPMDTDDYEIIEHIRDKNVIILLNKSDLDAVVTKEEIISRLDKKILFISVKNREGMDKLYTAIEEMFFQGKIQMNDQVFLHHARHKQALAEVQKSLILVKNSIEEGLPEDFYSIDLMHAYEELGKIIGESVEDDLVNEIFSKFCMGK
ncbi:tRNA modification GTPase MnmE [Lachnospiraceae bacterium]|jgi:tRNA modification GTPase|nr:tRNA uridine-5-carboxymethylaminomethyl(34) synthesis GTPase MnmE [Eubacterium sp.]GFI26298.1 tRNA modification GTPase MnmE [Lachnospiraceae bacterium]